MSGRAPAFAITTTPLGWTGTAASERGLVRSTLFRAEREEVQRELLGAGAVPGQAPLLDWALREVEALASGRAANLDAVPVDLCTGSDLQRRAWEALRLVPRGETRTYTWLAERIGLGAGSARAVGAAVARNPLPLFLPCHRIVGRDGSLRGFAGGLAMKEQLLILEGALPPRWQEAGQRAEGGEPALARTPPGRLVR